MNFQATIHALLILSQRLRSADYTCRIMCERRMGSKAILFVDDTKTKTVFTAYISREDQERCNRDREALKKENSV
ncbi:hypothetical protein IWZ03DRAFT_372923 [Phyllosticta citriasiana]|uniref:Secreted protein n=1 Tax=Phyllosticta citriasiana TaxID=595635 RepID=A0ABR1KTS7_9PEZI